MTPSRSVPGTESRSSTRRRPSLSNTVRDQILNELILNGAVAPGERMPTEADICARYNVSRITVRAALRSLRDAGYIDVRQGLGSTVLPRPQILASGLDQLTSIDSLAADQDSLSTGDVEMEEIALGEQPARQLAVPPGTRALVIRRVKLHRGTPVAWVVDYVLEGFLDFITLRKEFTGSVLDVLLAHEELQVEYSDATVTALPADRPLARRLHVEPGTTVISLDELTLTRSGEALNLSHCWMLPEHFRFTLRRRRGHN